MPLNPAIADWRGKRVWLVGASSGIGRAVAVQLHAQGAQVIVSARQQALLDAFVQQHPGSQALQPLGIEGAGAVAPPLQQRQRSPSGQGQVQFGGQIPPAQVSTFAAALGTVALHQPGQQSPRQSQIGPQGDARERANQRKSGNLPAA